MKSLYVLLMFCFVVYASNAQNFYSVENLQTLSQEELDVQLNKAIKLQKTGKVVNIVGCSILGVTAASIAGLAIFDQGDWALGGVVIGFFGGLAGVGTLAVGIPMNITGKKRIERINLIKETALQNISIDIKPSAQFNAVTQNYQPAITFAIRF